MPRAAGTKRHIVFVSLVFYPDTSATSLLFTDLFRRLVRDDVAVTVLCGFPSKDGREEVSALPRAQVLDGIEILRCGLRLQGKSSLAARALAYSSFLVHAAWRLLRIGSHATVVGGTDPPFTPIALWAFSLTHRFRYQCMLLDIYPDGLVALGKLADSSPITRVWRSLNRLSYRRADRLVVIGRDMIRLLECRYGIDGSRVAYLPHWGTAEADTISSPDRSRLITPLGLENKIVVQYSGNMGLWHDMESLVRAADRLREDDRIHFLFIGKGMRRRSAEELSRTLRLTNITWLEFLSREQLAQSLPSCDIALISLRSGLEGVAVPSKLYGILAAGRPVVAQVPAESEVAYVVREEDCGLVVQPGDLDDLVSALRKLAHDPGLRTRMGARGAAAYRSKYTIDAAVAAFEELWGIA